jgi:hypothetical protein
MPCRTVWGAREVDVHTLGNALHALGVHGACTTSSERVLRRDLRLVGAAGSDWAASTVARRGADGEAATAGLPPKPLSPRACARSASAREREGRCGAGVSVADEWGRGGPPGRRLVADWGSEVEGVRERE